jgi:hypothetical protein
LKKIDRNGESTWSSKVDDKTITARYIEKVRVFEVWSQNMNEEKFARMSIEITKLCFEHPMALFEEFIRHSIYRDSDIMDPVREPRCGLPFVSIDRK